MFTILAVVTFLPVVSGFLYDKNTEEILQLLCVSIFFGGTILFQIIYEGSIYTNGLNQQLNLFVFPCTYAVSIICAVCFPLMQPLAWPYLFVALALFLFSNITVGILSYSFAITVSCMLRGCDFLELVLYFICGMIVMIFFGKLDKRYKYAIPTFVSLCTYIVMVFANVLLFNNELINLDMMILPVINLFITTILFYLLLKLFSITTVHKYRERYMTINDTEFTILATVKKADTKAYYRAIHTSYLTDKLSKRFSLDADSVKTASYYWKIIDTMKEKDKKGFMEKINTTWHFPPDAIQLLNELLDKKTRLTSKEAIAVYTANLIIENIQQTFLKDKNAQINYKKMIDELFNERMKFGIFEKCDYTYRDLNMMKKLFIDEELYYDFLR